jgi:hypothetical protein
MKSRKNERLSLDDQSAAELGYAQADMNSPARQPDVEGRIFSRPERTPVPRRSMIPIHACGPEYWEIFKRLSANAAPGEIIEPRSEQDRRDLARLEALSSYPVGDVPWGYRSRAPVAARNAAKLLVGRLAPVIEGKMVDPDFAAGLEDVFNAAFGFPADQVWVLPFLEELRVAALQRLNWNCRLAKLDEKTRAGHPEPPALLEHAASILRATREAMVSWPVPCDVPEWLDVSLIASLIPRFGFQVGRGGAGRVISEKKMTRLLTNPTLLIRDLKSSPKGVERWKTHIEKLEQEIAARSGTKMPGA